MRAAIPPDSSWGYCFIRRLASGTRRRSNICSPPLEPPSCPIPDEPVGGGDLRTDAEDGIERGAGVLEDDGDAFAAHRPEGSLVEPSELLAFEGDRSRGLGEAPRRQPDGAEREERLSAPRLADERGDRGPGDRERDVVQQRDDPVVGDGNRR